MTVVCHPFSDCVNTLEIAKEYLGLILRSINTID